MAKAKADVKQWFSTRDILWYLVFSGFAVNYMIRINLNIAIVSMVKQKPKDNFTLVSECIKDPISSNSFRDGQNLNLFLEDNATTVILPASVLNVSEEEINLTDEQDDIEDSATFMWNEYHQGLILGAFFWFHWLTQIPGGILAQKYGTKLVFGLSNFVGVLCCFIIPVSAYWGYPYLVAVRMFQGIICGFSWPAMHNMTAKWIPPNERSKFVTAYLGSSVGVALTYPMCGWIIDKWNWEVVFYVNGILGSIWYLLWWLFVFDSPVEHPRITQAEKEYILSSIGQSVSKEKAPVPWKNLLFSLPVWMNILAQWGGLWGLFTLMTHAPTYFKFIHGWNITATGLLSGLPHILRMLFAVLFSQLGDYLLRTNKMSRTNVRKLATVMCCIVQGIFMLGLAYSGCNYAAAIICLSAATAVNGAVSTGPLASLVDLSPNYASIIMGFCNTVVAIVGFLTPTVVSLLTYQNQTVGQWQKVFWISTLMLFVAGISYLLFAKSELQPWNSPQEAKDTEAEFKLLKEKQNSDENKVAGQDVYEEKK